MRWTASPTSSNLFHVRSHVATTVRPIRILTLLVPLVIVMPRSTGQVYPRRRAVRGGPRRGFPAVVPAQHLDGRVEVQRVAAASLGGLTKQHNEVSLAAFYCRPLRTRLLAFLRGPQRGASYRVRPPP